MTAGLCANQLETLKEHLSQFESSVAVITSEVLPVADHDDSIMVIFKPRANC